MFNRLTALLPLFTACLLYLSTDAHADQESRTHQFDRLWLEAKAKQRATENFVEQKLPEDSPLNHLSYDDYRKIQFQRGASIWENAGRQLRLNPIHPSFLFKTPVKLNLVVDGVSKPILYTREIFNYDSEQRVAKESEAQGYSGFNITTPINQDGIWDEFLVFQGGTYFRALGKGNWYGLSARGLAVNTARPSGEEFPIFTEFWIERPGESSKTLVIHAILESPSLTGAFTFIATPGEKTEIEVKSTLYPRTEITSFGIAPLTSMFLFNDLNRARFDDFSPAVHDSEGLFMLKSNNEKVWRPLSNPKKLQLSVFQDQSIKGFGLFQRLREFQDYNDIEARYESRPSAWVEPVGSWGPGHVELIEIPINAEIHDNIVAFWQPAEPMQSGQAYSFHYKIFWAAQFSYDQMPGHIVTSSSRPAVGMENTRDFVIDYAVNELPDDLQVHVSTSSGRIVGVVKQLIAQTGHYRVIIKFQPGDKDFAELRLALATQDKAWGETWLYRWTR